MYFSDEYVEARRAEHRQIGWKCHCLVESYLTRNYNESRAREYAQHGFSRRVKTLARCIDNVFQALPLNGTGLPKVNEVSDAVINIQAFISNVFGCVDNLAWIWVLEKGLKREDGSPIPDTRVGLFGKNNDFIRTSLSAEFQEYLEGKKRWFDNLKNFRHALAHRIPPYIPPHTIPTDKEAAYRQLEDCKAEICKRMNFAERERLFGELNRLKADQESMATFIPMITHSIGENSPQVLLHPQMLWDFFTIEEMAGKMLKELDH
jgi:hypothetical protein